MYCFMMLRILKRIARLPIDSNLVSSIANKKKSIEMFQNGSQFEGPIMVWVSAICHLSIVINSFATAKQSSNSFVADAKNN